MDLIRQLVNGDDCDDTWVIAVSTKISGQDS
jgi:hypothetical protein